MTRWLYTSNLEHFGYTRLQKNGPILLPSVGPFSKTNSEMFTQSGVFSLGMGIAQKVIGWSYKNWKEIISWGVTKYFLVYSKRLSHSQIFLSIFLYLAFSIGNYGDILVWCMHPYRSVQCRHRSATKRQVESRLHDMSYLYLATNRNLTITVTQSQVLFCTTGSRYYYYYYKVNILSSGYYEPARSDLLFSLLHAFKFHEGL